MLRFAITTDGCVEIYNADGTKLGEIRPMDCAFTINAPRRVAACFPHDKMDASISVSGKEINTLLVTVA